MPFGWEPRARDFPRRNRLVAGLSLGLVVVEAAKRSGSLISARLAGEMGRLVFAVPGSPLDPRAAGANGLLKEGAILVTEARDVVEQLAPLLGRPLPAAEQLEEPPDLSATPPPLEGDRRAVVEALGPVPTAVDEIIRHTGLHPAQVLLILLELDLAGRLERHAGGFVSLLRPPIRRRPPAPQHVVGLDVGHLDQVGEHVEALVARQSPAARAASVADSRGAADPAGLGTAA